MENSRFKFRAWMEDVNADWTDEDTPDKYEMIYEFAYEEHQSVNDMLRITNNLMQYTGLKDKNGVEIYESDRVRLYTKSEFLEEEDWNVYSGVVEFINGQWKIFDDKTNQPLYGFVDIKVIGNIYEDSHLLDNN